MCLIFFKIILWRTDRMIGGYEYPTLKFPFLKLKSMTGRVGVMPPIFFEVIFGVKLRIVWPMRL